MRMRAAARGGGSRRVEKSSRRGEERGAKKKNDEGRRLLRRFSYDGSDGEEAIDVRRAKELLELEAREGRPGEGRGRCDEKPRFAFVRSFFSSVAREGAGGVEGRGRKKKNIPPLVVGVSRPRCSSARSPPPVVRFFGAPVCQTTAHPFGDR